MADIAAIAAIADAQSVASARENGWSIVRGESDPGPPDHGEAADPRRQELFELITLCLWHADAMGLHMTAIHLNDALETLKGSGPNASG